MVGVRVLVGVGVRVEVGPLGVGVLVLVGVGPLGVGVLVGRGHITVRVAEKLEKLKVVLAETVLPGGIPGTAPLLSFDEIMMGEEVLAFHHQSPALSQT